MSEEGYDIVARRAVVSAELCSLGVLGYASAPRCDFSQYLQNPCRGHLHWHLFTLWDSWEHFGGELHFPRIAFIIWKMEGNSCPALTALWKFCYILVVEIRTSVCKQSQVRKCSQFQEAEVKASLGAYPTSCWNIYPKRNHSLLNPIIFSIVIFSQCSKLECFASNQLMCDVN